MAKNFSDFSVNSNHIKMAEAKKAHLENKVDDAAPQVSVAT